MGKSYMDDLAPNLRHGTELKGADQAAIEARNRMKARDSQSGMCYPAPFDEAGHQQRMKDWDAIARVEKRKNRGGQVFKRGDGLG